MFLLQYDGEQDRYNGARLTGLSWTTEKVGGGGPRLARANVN